MYTLEALLAREETLQDALTGLSNAKPIHLPQGICMIPMVGGLLQELEIRYQGGTTVNHPERQRFSDSLFHPDFERLIIGVDQFARCISHHGLVAYVEATFIGGRGGHATMLWEYGERYGPPGNSINTILRQLGVIRSPGLDEFDTIELGKYRITKQWIDESET